MKPEYENLLQRFQSGSPPSLEEFEKMVQRITKPFTTHINGADVTVTGDMEARVGFHDAAVIKLKPILLDCEAEEKKRKSDGISNEQNKRRRTGNAAVNTVCGANGVTAIAQSQRRDKAASEAETKKRKSRLEREQANISNIRTYFAILKTKEPDTYFTITNSSKRERLQMFLRILAPDCGLVSKPADLQRDYLYEKCGESFNRLSIESRLQSLATKYQENEGDLDEIYAANNEDDDDNSITTNNKN